MKKVLLFLALLLFNYPAFANYDFTMNGRNITYNEDRLKFYENNEELSVLEVQKLFPEYEIILISKFNQNKKYKINNSLFKSKKVLLLNDENYRTFHLFYIFPESSRDEFQNFKKGEIKSLITIYGKKNVRLKHSGGDEFILDVR